MFDRLLHEIRSQSEPVRRILMYLCVATSCSLVIFVWFRSTEARVVALLNADDQITNQFSEGFAIVPKQTATENLAAATPQESPSNFSLSSLRNTFNLMRASIGELFGGQSASIENKNNFSNNNASSVGGDSYPALPLSPER